MRGKKTNGRTTWLGRKIVMVAFLGMVLFFTGGIVIANGSFASVISPKVLDDEAWAKSEGIIPATSTNQQSLKQAEFLKMLLTIYQPEKQGVIVPKGAENHWAAHFYATAKSEGLIDCSCQITPDKEITFQETTKFVTRAINKKIGTDTVTLDLVQAWAKHAGDVSTPVNVGEVVVLLRNMDGMLAEKPEKNGGSKDEDAGK